MSVGALTAFLVVGMLPVAASAAARNTPSGALVAALQDPAGPSGFYFGSAVAVSGKTAIVGAYETDSAHGVAYIYVKGASGWPTTPTLALTDPAATEDDLFGISVAVSGKTAVVGAYGTNGSAGAAYIYVKGASGWPTTPTTTLSDPDATTAHQFFGYSMAVSRATAVVGAPDTPDTNSEDGAAYIYKS